MTVNTTYHNCWPGKTSLNYKDVYRVMDNRFGYGDLPERDRRYLKSTIITNIKQIPSKELAKLKAHYETELLVQEETIPGKTFLFDTEGSVFVAATQAILDMTAKAFLDELTEVIISKAKDEGAKRMKFAANTLGTFGTVEVSYADKMTSVFSSNLDRYEHKLTIDLYSYLLDEEGKHWAFFKVSQPQGEPSYIKLSVDLNEYHVETDGELAGCIGGRIVKGGYLQKGLADAVEIDGGVTGLTSSHYTGNKPVHFSLYFPLIETIFIQNQTRPSEIEAKVIRDSIEARNETWKNDNEVPCFSELTREKAFDFAYSKTAWPLFQIDEEVDFYHSLTSSDYIAERIATIDYQVREIPVDKKATVRNTIEPKYRFSALVKKRPGKFKQVHDTLVEISFKNDWDNERRKWVFDSVFYHLTGPFGEVRSNFRNCNLTALLDARERGDMHRYFLLKDHFLSSLLNQLGFNPNKLSEDLIAMNKEVIEEVKRRFNIEPKQVVNESLLGQGINFEFYQCNYVFVPGGIRLMFGRGYGVVADFMITPIIGTNYSKQYHLKTTLLRVGNGEAIENNDKVGRFTTISDLGAFITAVTRTNCAFQDNAFKTNGDSTNTSNSIPELNI